MCLEALEQRVCTIICLFYVPVKYNKMLIYWYLPFFSIIVWFFRADVIKSNEAVLRDHPSNEYLLQDLFPLQSIPPFHRLLSIDNLVWAQFRWYQSSHELLVDACWLLWLYNTNGHRKRLSRKCLCKQHFHVSNNLNIWQVANKC